MPPDAIPAGAQIVTPYLLVADAERQMEFLAGVFAARDKHRPGGFFLRVEDRDAVYARALAAGAESVMEPMDMKHAGERYGGARDPAGNLWWIATHIEDVSPEERQARVDAWAAEGDSPWS